MPASGTKAKGLSGFQGARRSANRAGRTRNGFSALETANTRMAELVRILDDGLPPVCSPAYLEANGPVEELEGILSSNLLHIQAQHPSGIGWRRWLRSFGSELPSGSRQLAFNNYYHVIQACMGGQGFALDWFRMLGNQLKNGQLAAPLSEQAETDDQYCLAYPRRKSPQRDLAPFHDWLIEEFGQPTRADP